MSSSKSSKDTFEPLKVETTLLKIELKTFGDIVTKEYDLIPFHPNMADMKDLSNNNYILFPSFVKITMTDLKKSGAIGNGQDYKKIFTNLEKFINLIKYVTRPNKEDEDFTLLVDQTQYKNYAMSFVKDFTSDITSDFRTVQKYEPLSELEIITNNIGLIKSLFFPVNGRFYILGHDYIINKSQYIPPYKASIDINRALEGKKKIPLHYDITIELQLLDATNNPNVGDFGRLSCKAKKVSITNDIHEMFYTKIDGKERPKAVLPSLTVPTTTSKRGFSKLQLEWEERNKFIKQALTEKERLEQENKKTSLQKKMDKFEKKQEEYNKIPPLWIKETKAIDNKYNEFEKDAKGFQDEYKELKKNSLSLLELDGKIKDAIDLLIDSAKTTNPEITYSQTDIDALTSKIKSDTAIIVDKDPFIKNLKEGEKKIINSKYVAPFLIDMEEKKKDVDALQKEYDSAKAQVAKDTGTVNAQASQQELFKVQNKLLKAKTDYTLLQGKLGEKGDGQKLVEGWSATLTDMESFKETVNNEKTSSEKKIVNESVNIELKKKLEEINKLKKILYLAKFKEGNINEVTKSEKDKFEKEPVPIESVKTLETNLKSLEDDYLEIANKISTSNKVQGIITLLTADLNRIKDDLRNSKESEKKSIDSKIKTNSDEISNLSRIIKDPENIKDPNVKRIADLQADQKKNDDKLQPRVKFIEKALEFETIYNAKIKELRDSIKNVGRNTTINSSIINELRTKFSDAITQSNFNTTTVDTSEDKSGGGRRKEIIIHNNTRRNVHIHNLKKKNTKRRLIKLKRLIKTLKRHYKKRKRHYTRRHD
jgi:hypothetical protein